MTIARRERNFHTEDARAMIMIRMSLVQLEVYSQKDARYIEEPWLQLHFTIP